MSGGNAMPREVSFCVESSATVEQIHWAFSEADYWLARIAATGGFGRLDSLSVRADGGVAVAIVHELRHEGLPKPVAKFFPRDWQVVQDETWTPTKGGVVRGEVGIETHGAPGAGHGIALLAPARRGSTLKCTATVEFKVPFVGGTIENLIGRLMIPGLSGVQDFTGKWIAEHS
jgi:hypothetical protein